MAIKLPKKVRKERGTYFTEQIEIAESDRSGLLEKLHEVRDYYYREPGGAETDTPWEGAVDIHLPVIMDKIETAVPKITSALWRAEPFVNVRSPGGGGSDVTTKNVEKFTSWAFRNDIPDMYPTLENFSRNMLIDGTAIGKVRWVRKWRHTVENHVIKRMHKAGSANALGGQVEQDTEKLPDEILMEVFGFGDATNGMFDYKSKGAGKYSVRFTEAGRVYDAEVELTDHDVIDEVVVKVFRRVIEQDSPEFDLVDIEDFVLPYRAKSIGSASWVAQKTWYTVEQVKQKVEDGDWSLTRAQLSELQGHKRASDEDSEVEADRDGVIGEGTAPRTERESADGAQDPNRVMVWELYCKDKVPGMRDKMDVVYFILDEMQYVAGAEYHDELFPHGKRPFVASTYIPVPNRFFGLSMAEILYSINTEVDNTISTVHNLTELMINPFFFYSPFAMAQNGKLLDGLRPGEGIPTTDPNAVRFPEWSQQPLQLFHGSFNTLLGFADRMTFSPGVAGNNNYRNAPRTARGTLALMDQAEEKLSSIVEQMQATAWKDMVTQVVALYGRYVGVDKWYYVTGEARPRRISPRELRHNFMYEFSGSLTSVNREAQRALAQQRFQVLRMDPSYNNDPHARLNLVRDFLKHMTEGGEYEHLLPAAPGQGGAAHPPMTQEDETQAMALGVFVEVLPTDDHKDHMAQIDKIRNTEVFDSFDQTTVAMLAAHYKSHQTAAQQQALLQQRAMEVGTDMGPPGDMGGALVPPEAGAPVEGQAAVGGELSAVEGGAV